MNICYAPELPSLQRVILERNKDTFLQLGCLLSSFLAELMGKKRIKAIVYTLLKVN